MKKIFTVANVMVASTLISQADVTISGLSENFEASSAGNSTTLWNNLVGTATQDFTGTGTTADTTLSAVTSAGTTIASTYGFTGTSGFTSDPGNPFLSLADSNSFELWIRPTNIGTYATTDGMVIWETGGGKGLHFRINEAGELAFYAEGGDSGGITFDLSTLSVFDNGALTDFIQVVGTADKDGGATGTKLYVNGTPAGTAAGNSWNGTGDNDGLALVGGTGLGGFGNNLTVPYEGDIAIFRVYDDILTPEEVDANYQALAGGAALQFAITEIAYAPDAVPNPTVTLTWSKTGAATYVAKVSPDMSSWGADLDDGINDELDENPGDTDHITVTFPLTNGLENAADLFFRIEEG